MRGFLDRIYHGLRNTGQTPQERALNFAATSTFQVQTVFESAVVDKMELDTIEVERSPVGRPGRSALLNKGEKHAFTHF